MKYKIGDRLNCTYSEAIITIVKKHEDSYYTINHSLYSEAYLNNSYTKLNSVQKLKKLIRS